MQTITTKQALRTCLANARSQGKNISLVPTMGNLHEGHLELVRGAKQNSDYIVATIFVNPMQFGEDEDLDAYPRTLEQDSNLLENLYCDVLFVPSVTEIYATSMQHQTKIHVPDLGEEFCGASRPGHFDGVTTIVNKLFNLVMPDTAFFGLKDYQQYLLILKMVEDLEMDIQIIGVETQRDSSGLALSSRNAYLTATQKQIAANLYRCLQDCAQAISKGNREYSILEQLTLEEITAAGLKPDYLGIRDSGNLQAATAATNELVILAAAYLGDTRLIDNVRIPLKS